MATNLGVTIAAAVATAVTAYFTYGEGSDLLIGSDRYAHVGKFRARHSFLPHCPLFSMRSVRC